MFNADLAVGEAGSNIGNAESTPTRRAILEA